MNYPTFNDKGDISMMDVMNANIGDFITDLGIPFVINELTEFLNFIKSCETYCGTNHFQSRGYDKLFSDYIHDKLKEYETEDGKKRTPNYTLTPKYCFWYNIYCNMIHAYPFHHCSELDSQKFHVEMIEKIINVINT